MDYLFSPELKMLISNARDTAIDLGYDYISTIHFFIADCNSGHPNSIKKFGFSSDEKYKKFTADYTLKVTDYLTLVDESLPLTLEAEKTIKLAYAEQIARNQTSIYPCHLFVAALKNQESLLFKYFSHDEHALNNLLAYYDELGEFEKNKAPQAQHTSKGFINQLSALFKRNK